MKDKIAGLDSWDDDRKGVVMGSENPGVQQTLENEAGVTDGRSWGLSLLYTAVVWSLFKTLL